VNIDLADLDQWAGKVLPLQEGVRAKATELELDPALAQALIHQESQWNPNAVSPTGVTGLAQVTIPTGRPYGQTPATRTDPEVSTHAGLSYFKDLLAQSNGDVRQALTRYNGGSDPQYADHVLQHYPLFAGPGAARPTSGAAGPGNVDLTDLDRWIATQGQPAAPAQGQPAAPAQGQPAAPRTGGYPIAITIEKPSTGNPPGPRTAPGTPWQQAVAEQHQLTPVGRVDIGTTFGPEGKSPEPGGWRDAGALGIDIASTAVGAIGGAGLGTLALGPGAGTVLGGMAGEAGGGFVGHKINQALGLRPGDPTTFDPTLWPPSGDVLAVGTPPVVRGIGALGKQVVKRLPGAAGALHEDAVKALGTLPERFAPEQPSSVFYGQLAADTNPRIRATNLATEASAVLREQLAKKPSFRNTTLMAHAQDLIDVYRGHQGQIPIGELHVYQKDIGLLQRQAERAAAPELGSLKRLYRGIAEDMDAAAAQGTPEARALLQANQARRREYAQADLAEMFTPGAPGMTTRPDGLVQVHGGKLTDRFNKKLTDDPVFAKSFTPQERTEILDLLHSMQKIPRIPAPKGVAIGSGLAAARGGFVYGVSELLLKDKAMATALGALALAAPHILSQATMSAPGRFLIRQYISAGQVIGPAELAALRSVVEQHQKAPAGAPAPTAPVQR
jgi:hypothetical protein